MTTENQFQNNSTSNEPSESIRNSNLIMSKKIISDIAETSWGDMLDDNAVFEYPYATSINYPIQVVGKAAIIKYLQDLIAFTKGLIMFDIVNKPMLDPNVIYNEYKGTYGIAPNVTQNYVSIQKFKNGKLVLQREFWDPTPFIKIIKDLKA